VPVETRSGESGRRCAWHRCHGRFLPERRNQIYCRPACRAAWQAWARMRGMALVQPLVDGDADRLEGLREDLVTEVEEARQAVLDAEGKEGDGC